jgi:hypothetical protein
VGRRSTREDGALTKRQPTDEPWPPALLSHSPIPSPLRRHKNNFARCTLVTLVVSNQQLLEICERCAGRR